MKSMKHIEDNFSPEAHLEELIAKERREAVRYGGRTVFDDIKSKKKKSFSKIPEDRQLKLFYSFRNFRE